MEQTKKYIIRVMDEKLEDIEDGNKAYQVKFQKQSAEIDEKLGEMRHFFKNSKAIFNKYEKNNGGSMHTRSTSAT